MGAACFLEPEYKQQRTEEQFHGTLRDGVSQMGLDIRANNVLTSARLTASILRSVLRGDEQSEAQEF